MDSPIKRMDRRLAELGRTYTDLARDIGESPQTINNWRSRGRIPTGKVAKLAEKLEISTDYLLAGNAPETGINLLNLRGLDKKTVQNLEKLVEYYLHSSEDGRTHIVQTALYVSQPTNKPRRFHKVGGQQQTGKKRRGIK